MAAVPPPDFPPVVLDRRTLTDHRGPPHTHDRHVVLVPVAADGELAWRAGDMPTRKAAVGEVVVWPAGQPAAVYVAGSVEVVCVSLTAEAWLVAGCGHGIPGPPAAGCRSDDVARRIAELLADLPDPVAGADVTDRLRGALLARLLAEHAADPGDGEALAAVRPAVALIDADPAAPHTVAGLARAAGLSPHHFSRVFLRATGLPPHRYLVARRVALARARLEAGAAPADAAVDAGFSSQSHLAHHVRRLLGTTPGRLASRAPHDPAT